MIPAVQAPCTDDTLVIAEAFGPTFQGEGPSAGKVATFIRLGGCDLKCRWCDSAYTWDARRYDLRAELRRVAVADLLEKVDADGAHLTVITGGEPLLHQQQDGWRTLLDGLAVRGRVEVETNGTVQADAYTVAHVDAFHVSPKLAHAGMSEAQRINPAVLRAFAATGKAIFKWVCRTPADVDRVAAYAADLDLPTRLTWIMPEGRSAETLATVTGNIVNRTLHHRFNFTGRMHVMLWGDERGR